MGLNFFEKKETGQIKPMNTAVRFHIEHVVNGIPSEIEYATAENIELFKDHVEYHKLTLLSAIELGRENGDEEIALVLEGINNRVSGVFEGVKTGEERLNEIHTIVSDLKKLME